MIATMRIATALTTPNRRSGLIPDTPTSVHNTLRYALVIHHLYLFIVLYVILIHNRHFITLPKNTMVDHMVEAYPKPSFNHVFLGMVQPYDKPWSTIVDQSPYCFMLKY